MKKLGHVSSVAAGLLLMAAGSVAGAQAGCQACE